MSLFLIALLPFFACGDKDEDSGGGGDGGGGDGGGDGGGSDILCDDGLHGRVFQAAEDDETLFALAADATIPTQDGDYRLSEHWSGCDVLVFLHDEPGQADSDEWSYALYERDLDELFERAPLNSVFFFGSDESDESDRSAAVEMIQEEIADALEDMDEKTRTWWEGRIHYVDGRYRDVEGWVGNSIQSPGWGTVLDREQRIRYVGSLADVDRYSNSVGWFAPNISMAANEVVYANFLAARAERLEGDGATIVPVWDQALISDTGWAGVRGSATVELPDAATMASFDTLELDLTMNCNGEGEYGTCPPWDYLVYLYLCDEGQTSGCSTELGRWITTYHRAGRFVHDASSLLPLLGDGGTRTFEFYTTQEYVVSLDLRLRDAGKATRPQEASFLFSGGGFGATYNDNYNPVEVEIPADAVKVELATVISGHGQVSPGTCAEFCETEHHFIVNGTDNERVLKIEDQETGCMEMADEGVIPNQYGTWWYGRAGWCPGWQVPVVTIDITDQVSPGATATIDYEGYRDGAPYTTDGAWIDLKSWVVVHR